MAEKIVVPDAVRDALVAFRAKEISGRHYIVLGYEGKNVLKIEAQGEGFADDALALFPDGECRYAYLRLDHIIEKNTTTKFVLLDWTPDAIAPMRKALLSTHKAQIAQLLQPVHVSIQASTRSEISNDIVEDKIGMASGTKSNVTSKSAFKAAAVDISRSAAAKEADYLPASAKSSRTVEFKDEDAIRAAFKAVRADSDPTDWALLGFADEGSYQTLELKASGSAGIPELIAALNPAQPNYALFRTREQIDKTTAIRFSFLRVVPTTLPAHKKAHIGSLNGVIQDLFKPYAWDFDKSDVADFSADEVHDKISGLSGMKNMSLTANAAAGVKVQHPLGALSSPSGAGSGVGAAAFIAQPAGAISLSDDLKAALAAVRQDAKPGEQQTAWALAAKVPNQDALSLVASGTNPSVEDIKQHLQADNINFALLRVQDKIDQSVTIKFVLIQSQPDAVPALKKSAVATKLGLYKAVFTPHSSDFFLAKPDDLTQEHVQDQVASASGSKSKEVAKK